MRLHQYQGAMTVGGREKIGLVNISFGRNRATVSFELPGERPVRLASFSKSQWIDQDGVNASLRGKGLLWRRSVSEIEYASRAQRITS
jgi:hypothetical protein